MDPRHRLWHIRPRGEMANPHDLYGDGNLDFTMKLHYNGGFTSTPGRVYKAVSVAYIDLLNGDTFSVMEVNGIVSQIRFRDENIHVPLFYCYRVPGRSLDDPDGVLSLAYDEDVRNFIQHVDIQKEIDVFVEIGATRILSFFESPNRPQHQKLEIVELQNEDEDQQPSSPLTRKRKLPVTRKKDISQGTLGTQST